MLVQVTGGSALVSVFNDTTGSNDAWSVNLEGWDPGSSAEYIDERQGGAFPLANYGKTSWTNMQVLRSNSGSWTGAYSEPTEWWYYLYSDSVAFNNKPVGTLLSKTTGSYSDNHMQDTYYASGPCQPIQP